jgi:hypothetical protein
LAIKGWGMAKGNKCLGCRFGSVKLEILVPENCNLREFMGKTQDFAFNIISITKEKPIL